MVVCSVNLSETPAPSSPPIPETIQVIIPVFTSNPVTHHHSYPLPAPTFTLTPVPSPSEPAGCQEPPQDYARIDLTNATLNARTYAMLQHADSLYPGSPSHIHAVAVGDAELSHAAYLQIHGSYGYLAGMDGLPPEEGSDPAIDPHGGPVICNWMEE